MFRSRKADITQRIGVCCKRTSPLTYDTLLTNTILTAEIALNRLSLLRDHIKNSRAELGVNDILILGAELEMLSDEIDAITLEHSLPRTGN